MAMEPEELRKLLKKLAVIGSFFALAFAFYVLRWRTALGIYIVVVGVLAVLAILLQAGRGGGLAASLGGFGADSLLGAHSATPIAKATYVMLGLFIFIAILASKLTAIPQQRESLLLVPPVQAPAPGVDFLPLDVDTGLDQPLEPFDATPPADADSEEPPADD